MKTFAEDLALERGQRFSRLVLEMLRQVDLAKAPEPITGGLIWTCPYCGLGEGVSCPVTGTFHLPPA